MMATTHVLWGILLALPIVRFAPEYALVAIVAGGIGGLLPDFDLYLSHRKTLHFPYLASLASLPAAGAALLFPSPWTIAFAIGVIAAALHAVSDIFGGGLELRPWEGTSDRGVYSHVHGRWIRPRRTIRYDGSPEDLVLAGVPVLPLVTVGGDSLRYFAVVLFGISVIYVVFRRHLAEIAASLADLLPRVLRPYIPRRYRME